ncbi:MAG: Cof-type HAD-IIB family hydrolase [Candidatus Izimaplasma sp.]|nr:Cof-type HAD-IIB family hydrolase [Candidatus Izimaplasma bacterium]
MKKYLFALALDGTLLHDWESISKPTKDYFRQLQADGHKIVLATGRPFRSSEPFHRELGLDTPLINYNGGLVTSHHDDTFKPYSLTIPKEYILTIFNDNIDYIDNCFGEVKDDIFLYKDTKEIEPLLHNFNGARLFVGDLNMILNDNTNGFIIVAKPNKADLIETYVNDKFENRVLCRNWGEHYHHVLELYTPETNKGKGLKYVAEHLKVEQENIIAFGDAHNDIEMLQYAHLGVAMQNAQERLKVYADDVTTLPNTEDGLIDYIDKFLKNNSDF